ncbi:MAG TPA: hypothetical protein VEQ11_05320, partial [Chloroflexota bacterium]|nr:hypothetical protein [Chloroflexota bacterium]
DRLRFVTTPAPTPGGTRMATEYQYDEVGNRSLGALGGRATQRTLRRFWSAAGPPAPCPYRRSA